MLRFPNFSMLDSAHLLIQCSVSHRVLILKQLDDEKQNVVGVRCGVFGGSSGNSNHASDPKSDILGRRVAEYSF